MSDATPQTNPTPPPDSQAALGDAVRRLRDLLQDLPGTHDVLADSAHRVRVLSYDGDVLAAPGTDTADPQAVTVAKAVLARAGIQADVERLERAVGPAVLTTVHSAEGVNRLFQAVIDTLPHPLKVTRELVAVMREHNFCDPAAVYTLHGHVKGIQLTLEDARKVRAALGEPQAAPAPTRPQELYAVADDLARFRSEKLGGDSVGVRAYPARGILCDYCMDDLLVLGPLTIAQAEALTSALARTLLEVL
ncbi:hypothetical protein AB0G68_30160 [Streptomyces eurythermus]|uniref:hypothetical protein n=1 Tax=Streptomyces eurythermus TaxID=42237 RepID=UPI0033D7EE57